MSLTFHKPKEASGGWAWTEVFTLTNGQTVINLTNTPVSNSMLDLAVERNGVLQELTTNYTVVGNVITLVVGGNLTVNGAGSETIRVFGK